MSDSAVEGPDPKASAGLICSVDASNDRPKKTRLDRVGLVLHDASSAPWKMLNLERRASSIISFYSILIGQEHGYTPYDCEIDNSNMYMWIGYIEYSKYTVL